MDINEFHIQNELTKLAPALGEVVSVRDTYGEEVFFKHETEAEYIESDPLGNFVLGPDGKPYVHQVDKSAQRTLDDVAALMEAVGGARLDKDADNVTIQHVGDRKAPSSGHIV